MLFFKATIEPESIGSQLGHIRMQQNLLFLPGFSRFSQINTLICCQTSANFQSSEKADSDHFCQGSLGLYGGEHSQRSSLCRFCWCDTQKTDVGIPDELRRNLPTWALKVSACPSPLALK